MDSENYPKTIEGAFQFLQDIADDYANHQHDGTSTRRFDTVRANGVSTGALSIRKVGYGDTTAGLWSGVVNGIPQFYLGNASNYIKFDGVNFSILGALSVTQLDIPDATTANSFHTDANGNSWWGANVATGYTGANAYILNTGAATFKNISIGGTTVQYVITNSGIFSYGDGSDGDATISVNTTLSGDKYYRNLTIDSGAILNLGQWRLFCSQSLTLSGNASIQSNGNPGDDGSGNAVHNGGAAVAAGYFLASAAGGGSSAPGNVTHSLGSLGGNGGGTAPGTLSVASVKLIANWHLATMLDVTAGVTALFQGGSGASRGSFGAAGLFGPGAGGSAAGIIAVYAKTITINSGSTITATGGKGGNGQVGGTPGGGGGGGGPGGIIVLVYNMLTNSGSVTATGGIGGTGGGGGASDGPSGGGGTIYQFQLSL